MDGNIPDNVCIVIVCVCRASKLNYINLSLSLFLIVNVREYPRGFKEGVQVECSIKLYFFKPIII